MFVFVNLSLLITGFVLPFLLVSALCRKGSKGRNF